MKLCLHNRTTRRAVLRALIALQSGCIPSRSKGICCNVAMQSSMPYLTAIDIVCELAKGWDGHNGCTIYPVPRAYPRVGKWVGVEGQARQELITYIITRLRKEKLV